MAETSPSNNDTPQTSGVDIALLFIAQVEPDRANHVMVLKVSNDYIYLIQLFNV